MSHKKAVVLLVVLHLIGFAAFALWRGCNDDREAEPPLDAAEIEQMDAAKIERIDVVSRELAEITPGTEIVDCPPQGWSHLIIKSWPNVGPDTRGKVSDSVAAIVSLLFTAITADVQKEEADDGTASPAAGGTASPAADGTASYYLAKLAIGVGADVDGRHLTLTPETQQELGADLGLIDRQVLSVGRDKFREMRGIARSKTTALLDSPEILLHDGQHRRVLLRYAILVDAATGRLDTLLWALDLDERGNISGLIGPIQLLPADKVEDCTLHADPDAFVLGVPTAIAFAMTSIPQGRRTFACPASLKELVTQSSPTADSARQLQRQLRELIRSSFSPVASNPQ